jgi:hypothetical protein
VVSGDAAADTLMWEVRAAQGALPELLAWVEQQLPAVVGVDGADPRTAGLCTADLYTAADDRIVVILRSAPGAARPARLPEPPAALLARPPHQWPFAFHGRWDSPGQVQPQITGSDDT